MYVSCSFKEQKPYNLLSGRNEPRGLERHDRQDRHSNCAFTQTIIQTLRIETAWYKGGIYILSFFLGFTYLLLFNPCVKHFPAVENASEWGAIKN